MWQEQCWTGTQRGYRLSSGYEISVFILQSSWAQTKQTQNAVQEILLVVCTPQNYAGISLFGVHIRQLVTPETSSLKWLILLFSPSPAHKFLNHLGTAKVQWRLCPSGAESFWRHSCKNFMESVVTKAGSFPGLCVIQANQRAAGEVASRYILQRLWEHDSNTIPISYHLAVLLHLAIASSFAWCLISYWTLSDPVGQITSTMSNHLFVASYY